MLIVIDPESAALVGISIAGMPGILIESIFAGAGSIFIPGMFWCAESPCIAWEVSAIGIAIGLGATRFFVAVAAGADFLPAFVVVLPVAGFLACVVFGVVFFFF
jgi:hypothetical protein